MSKEKKTQDYIIKMMGKVAGSRNAELYKNRFKGMSDKDFREWFDEFLAGDKDILNMISPTDGSVDVSYNHNKKFAKELGVKFFDNITFTNKNGKSFRPPARAFIVDAFVRVPSQTADKALTVSDSKSLNPLSGQVRSASKVTAPENGILIGLRLVEVMKEYNRFRGGDEGLQQGLSMLLAKKGSASMEELDHFASGITSTETLDSYFKAMHMNIYPDD